MPRRNFVQLPEVLGQSWPPEMFIGLGLYASGQRNRSCKTFVLKESMTGPYSARWTLGRSGSPEKECWSVLPGAASAWGAPLNCGANCSGGGPPPPKPGGRMPGRRPMVGMPTPGVIIPGGSMPPGGSIMPGAIPGATPILWGGPSPGTIIPAEVWSAESAAACNMN